MQKYRLFFKFAVCAYKKCTEPRFLYPCHSCPSQLRPPLSPIHGGNGLPYVKQQAWVKTSGRDTAFSCLWISPASGA